MVKNKRKYKLNSWNHVAVTYSKGITTVFVNGVELKKQEGESTFEIWYPELDLRLSNIIRPKYCLSNNNKENEQP